MTPQEQQIRAAETYFRLLGFRRVRCPRCAGTYWVGGGANSQCGDPTNPAAYLRTLDAMIAAVQAGKTHWTRGHKGGLT